MLSTSIVGKLCESSLEVLRKTHESYFPAVMKRDGSAA